MWCQDKGEEPARARTQGSPQSALDRGRNPAQERPSKGNTSEDLTRGQVNGLVVLFERHRDAIGFSLNLLIMRPDE
jgi:hypothetical protein